MTQSATQQQPAGVRFGRLERRGLLAGLSGAQVALLGTALVAVVAVQVHAGAVGIVFAAPFVLALVAVALVPVGGRTVIEALPDAGGWALRRALGGRSGIAPIRPSQDGLSLPGVPGRVRVAEHDSGAARIFRAARPGTRTGPVTVVAEVRGRGFVLEAAGTQTRRVAAWARLLAALGQMPGVTGVQVLHRVVPDEGPSTIRAWWARQARTRSVFAERIVTDLLQEGPPTSRIQSLLAVTANPRGRDGLDGLLTALETAIDAAELDLRGWLTPAQLSRVLRESYDPQGAVHANPEIAAVRGPMGIRESWSHLRTDSAFHATYWVAEWPRSETHAGFLQPLLLPPGGRRTFTILAQPLSPAKALREIRRARAEQIADATGRARSGRVEDEASRAAAAELTRREEDLIAGHGDLRFVGLLSVTAATENELAEDCAATEAAAAQAGCELRRLVGRQVPAFSAAALPLVRSLS